MHCSLLCRLGISVSSRRRPKLDAFVGVIDAIVEEDKTRPSKQRHTAKRVWERLKEEHQFTGGYTIVKNYLRSAAERSREMFVRLVHPAGEAQADFGEAVAVIVQVLRLLETFKLEEVTQAIEEALEMGTIGFDAVKHLLLCRIDQRPQGSTWRTIPTFRWPRSAPRRSPIT